MMRTQRGIMRKRIPVDSPASDDLRSNGSDDFNFLKCNEIVEIQNQELVPDDHYTEAYSLPFWMCRSPADSEYEISHLLSHNYHGTYSSPSSPLISRIQAVEDGQKVLMDIIQSMPESSYELSLRDIIDHQQILREDKKNETSMEENFTAESEHNFPRRKNYKSSRIQSSVSRVFLLKMFNPLSFVFNKKLKIEISSTIVSRPLSNGNVKPTPTTKAGCKIEKAFSDRRDKQKYNSTVGEGIDSNPTSTKRVLEIKFPNWWRFFSGRKFKLETNGEMFKGKQHPNTK